MARTPPPPLTLGAPQGWNCCWTAGRSHARPAGRFFPEEDPPLHFLTQLGAAAFLLTATLNAQALTIHVSTAGNDENPGTMEEPVQTLTKALDRNATEIIMEHGDYLLPQTTTVIPAGVVVRGGYKSATLDDGEFVWQPCALPTILLKTEFRGHPAFHLAPAASGGTEGGVMEHVRILGGFASVEMREGSRMTEVELGGGTTFTILLQQGNENRPALLERVRITGGGGAGIFVSGNSHLVLRDSLIRDVGGRGIDIVGSGSVLVEDSVIMRSGSDGVSISGNAAVGLFNNRILRSGESGVRARQSSPIIRGCLLERNADGIKLIDSHGSIIAHCTIVENRSSGISLERSTPDLHYNIIAKNNLYGVWEEMHSEEYFLGGDLVGNLFHDNFPGAYLDEGEEPYSSQEEININIQNEGLVEGNLVADPLFVNPAIYDYTLKPDSPAIDRAPADPDLETDLAGNPRNVALGDKNDNGVTDLGAFERQPHLRTAFGAEYWLLSAEPGTGKEIRRSPNWTFNPTSPFGEISARFLPGRLRFWSQENTSFGSIVRETKDLRASTDELVVLRATVAGPTGHGTLTPRLRINAHEASDFYSNLVIEGSKAIPPTAQGRQYEMVFDPRQGKYRTIPVEDLSSHPFAFSFDLLDFQIYPIKPYLDITGFEVEYVDRDLYDLQFNELLAHYKFDDGVNGWVSSNLSPEFKAPLMRYSGTREALEIVRPVDSDPGADYFGAWESPRLEVEPGTRLRVEARVSTNQDLESIPSFRFRISSTDFSYTLETGIAGLLNGPALPSRDGSVYTFYSTVPAGLEEDEIFVFFDLVAFDEPNRVGSVFLEELIITKTP